MQAEKREMTLVGSILMEMDQEAEHTKRLLEIVPEDNLSWRPHPKARSLGELAMHVATLQAGVAELARPETIELPDFPPEPEATSRAQLIDAFTESLKKAKEIVGATSEAQALAGYSITKDGRTIMAMPRIAFWRSILLNHLYHHRGQLSAYLRELDVPLPAMYGPSAEATFVA